MSVLLIFLDGIGLGPPDPRINPFVTDHFPTLAALAGGNPWTAETGYQTSAQSIFIPTDPRMGIAGRPQSGTGQAAIVTGRNIPALIGRHYGPKPDAATRALLDEDNLFIQLKHRDKTAAILEAYPPPWHRAINSGKRLPASYQYAARAAGLRFMDEDDYRAGRALSGDWTGEGWRSHMHYTDTPLYTPYDAGVKLAQIGQNFDFSFLPHWMTDHIGHRGTLEEAVTLLHKFDDLMRGLLDTWDDDAGLIIITSDHGNFEAMDHRKHTENDVPTVLIGTKKNQFAQGLHTLADIAPRILRALSS